MATTFQRFLEQARAAKALASTLRQAWADCQRLIGHHNANAYSTAGDMTKPAYVNEDAAGNIDGLDFSRGDYVALVVLALQIDALFTNQAVTQGDYRTTAGKVADA